MHQYFRWNGGFYKRDNSFSCNMALVIRDYISINMKIKQIAVIFYANDDQYSVSIAFTNAFLGQLIMYTVEINTVLVKTTKMLNNLLTRVRVSLKT